MYWNNFFFEKLPPIPFRTRMSKPWVQVDANSIADQNETADTAMHHSMADRH